MCRGPCRRHWRCLASTEPVRAAERNVPRRRGTRRRSTAVDWGCTARFHLDLDVVLLQEVPGTEHIVEGLDLKVHVAQTGALADLGSAESAEMRQSLSAAENREESSWVATTPIATVVMQSANTSRRAAPARPAECPAGIRFDGHVMHVTCWWNSTVASGAAAVRARTPMPHPARLELRGRRAHRGGSLLSRNSGGGGGPHRCGGTSQSLGDQPSRIWSMSENHSIQLPQGSAV